MGVPVTLDNFVRAESDTMIARVAALAGRTGVFHHDRELGPLDRQPVIRQNRDTLYSVAVVDVARGATLTVPEHGDRYLSVMVVNQDHYIERVFHDAGDHPLSTAELGTDFVLVAARILFDPTSEPDVSEVHALQDGLTITATEQREFVHPDYDPGSHRTVRDAVLVLGRTMSGLGGCFGPHDAVDPVRHFVGTATAWGGLPESEASYVNVEPGLPSGRYTMTFRDVPADAFWSLSVYDGDGYFDPGPSGRTNVNSVFGARAADGSVTVHLGDWDEGTPNQIPLPQGWNLLLRLYRPRLAELAAWRMPEIVPA